jgi:N-acetylmuramoyl-L-alanine amidase
LQVKVIYPSPNQTLTARDSNFIFGSVGSGLARLTIDGVDVPVYPNGAFLAWLAVPGGEKPRYELTATKGSETNTASVPVSIRAPALPVPDTGKLIVDRLSVIPAGRVALRADEPVRISIRAPQNARVTFRSSDGGTRSLARNAGVGWSTEVPARDLAHGGSIIVHRGSDSVEVKTAAVTLTDPSAPRFAELLNANDDAASDTDRVSILRPAPEGTYKWFLFPGTTLEVTGERGNWLRLRLDEQLEAWIDARAVNLLGESTIAPRRTAGNARVTVGDGFSDLRIPVTQRPAYLVEAVSPGEMRLTLYGVTGNVDIVNFATNDPTIRDVTWEQVATDRVRLTVLLKHEPYGYLTFWDRGAFVLRVRRPPAINAAQPLAGRVIVVDPGHPPIGSTGPTGLYEADAVLAVAEQLKPMLESRGATVVMTRTSRDPVALNSRPIIARRANADVLVSIHLNAHPDGTNPFRTNGSGTYFFHHQAEPLARAVQRGLVRHMGLRDLGVNYDNLAVARFTWAPAILCEGAFVIMPDQEAALRTEEFQKRYAMGILDGLEEYFRGLANTGAR